MPKDVLLAVIFINLALVFYTAGVWWERLAGELRRPHLLLFWAGCAADGAGTEMMYRILGHVEFNLHGVTGLTALSLMLIHALWASWVLWRGNPEAKHSFHRFSVTVWAVWLVPYFTGYLLSMGGH
jgi:uncharacterized repeat protein (TIGR03987 family)